MILKKVNSEQTDSGKHDLDIQVAVLYDAKGPAFESHRTWIYHNQVFLESDDGKRIDFSGDLRTTVSREGAVLIEYPFPDLNNDPDNYRFVYVAPIMILDVPVTLNFGKMPVQH